MLPCAARPDKEGNLANGLGIAATLAGPRYLLACKWLSAKSQPRSSGNSELRAERPGGYRAPTTEAIVAMEEMRAPSWRKNPTSRDPEYAFNVAGALTLSV